MAPPKIPGGGGGNDTPVQSNLPPWLDPNYGYKFTKNKKTGKVTKTYVGSTQYLNESLGNTPLQGVLNLLRPQDAEAAGAAALYGGNVKPTTANQAMYLFKNSDPAIRAQIQAMMYRAGGLYTGKYTPVPGAPLTKQDIDAFRKFLIGAASDPSQGPIGDLLQQSATAGDALGQVSKAVYNPLTEQVTSPQDIAETANKVGLALHGTYLSKDQMSVFTAAYQTMEKAFQEQKYTAGGGNLTTGMVDPDKATPSIVTQPPTIENAVSQEIRDQPNFKSNTFTDRLDEMLAGLKGAGISAQVGPG